MESGCSDAAPPTAESQPAAAAAPEGEAAASGSQRPSHRQRKSSGDAADTDSGRPTSVDDEEEDEPGLIIHIPPRSDSTEIKDQPEIKDQSGSSREEEGKAPPVRRIPTLVCEELRDEEEPESAEDQPSSSTRRIHRRALSKQCVIDDDTVTQQQPCIVSSPRREALGRDKLKTTLSPTPPPPPLTADQWESMAERRRELAAQLLGRTPLTLSQSEGNLERAKIISSSTSKTGGNAKQLVRSHALCGDDDTRLRPPAEFARSNPSFAATKSLSRDSSATDYTDSSGVDLFSFIVSTLHKNEKDRSILLDLERQLIDFLKDESRQSYKFGSMSSYNRMLVHRVAAFFGLDHNIDQSGQCIVVNRNDNTRIPEHSFASLIRSNAFTDTAKRSLTLSRDAQSYEEIREYPSLPHRMSLEMLSRKTRSFEVSGKRTLSPAWRNDLSAQSTDSAPPPHCGSPYTLSPVMQNSAEVPDERVETGVPHEARRRGVGLAQLHKAGSFGGVPVFYRNNSNGVRPVEEMRTRPRNGTLQPRSESQRSRPGSQNGMADPPDYYGSGSGASIAPPDPYYREDGYRPEYNGNTMPAHAYFQSDPSRMLYVDTYGAPVAAPPMDYSGGYYYAAPASNPMVPMQPVQQQQQGYVQPPDQMDQLAREMSGASISSSRQSQSPPQPAPAARQPAPVPYYSPVPAAVPVYQAAGYYAPVYQGYAMPYDSPVYFAPVHYSYNPYPAPMPAQQTQPVYQPMPMAYHNGTTYYTNPMMYQQNYGAAGYYGGADQQQYQGEEGEEKANGDGQEENEGQQAQPVENKN